MAEVNLNNLENTNRRIAESLEKIVEQLQQVNKELREIKGSVKHSEKMNSLKN